ncbi:MAG: hypothetical protein GF416_09055 [Candidatus Altiarchaeales archaeon]|nr:hypothetical protein [Candidatus Altiarchaeales archaeon]MBD3417266.1 hypothetical protein [Candidatus Altiarchaeales archaeon]
MAKDGRSKVVVLAFVVGLCAVAILIGSEVKEVDAVSVTYQVSVSGARPSISAVRCCFKESDVGAWADGDCHTTGESYTPPSAEYYDVMCNFTVSDSNGWQDMTDGWVNATWHHTNVNWDTDWDFDTSYGNGSCKNVTDLKGGEDIVFECQFQNIRYWANGGGWKLLVNSSDGSDLGTPSSTSFTVTNSTSIWQTATIDFGSMAVGETGSAGNTGNADVDAKTNNTGNTVIDLEVNAGAATMDCTINSIGVRNISYDETDDTAIGSACGTLEEAADWDCAAINLNDCEDGCAGATALDYTYWGIRIPSGVGGSCTLSVTFTGTQATP